MPQEGNHIAAARSTSAKTRAASGSTSETASDAPAGVVNLISGLRRERVAWLPSHMYVNVIDVSGCSDEELIATCEAVAANVKRVVTATSVSRSRHSPQLSR